MRYVFLVLLLSIFSAFSVAAYANCPDLSQVKVVCNHVSGNCYWKPNGNPGYEVLSQDGDRVIPGDKAIRFIRGFWRDSGAGQKNIVLGSTVCFYESLKSGGLTLMQNRFGGVPKPTGDNWKAGSWKQYEGSNCNTNPASCSFDYN